MQPQINDTTMHTLMLLAEITGLSQTELLERSVRLYSRPYKNEKGRLVKQKGWYLKDASNPQIRDACHILKSRKRDGRKHLDICLHGKIIYDVPENQIILADERKPEKRTQSRHRNMGHADRQK